MFEINRDPSHRELRQFSGIWFPAFWAVLGGLIGYRTGHWGVSLGLWSIVVVMSGVGLVHPDRMRTVYVGWMLAAAPVGWCVSRLILSLVYFLVLTPIGLAARAVGYDPMRRRFDRNATTYWVSRKQPTNTESYFHQF